MGDDWKQQAAQHAQAVHWKELEAKPVFNIEHEYVTFSSPTKKSTIGTADSLNFLNVSNFGEPEFFDKTKPEQVKEYHALQNAYIPLKNVIDRGHAKDLHAYLQEHKQQLSPVVVEKAMAYLVSRSPSTIDNGDPERGNKLNAFLEVMPWIRKIEFITQAGGEWGGLEDVKKSLPELIRDGYTVGLGSHPDGFNGEPALSKKIAAEIEKLNAQDKAKAAAQSQQQVRQRQH